MAIGTEIKIGFEAAAVKKGLGDMQGQFKAASSKLGSIMKIGLLGGVAAASIGVGKAISGALDTADWAGEMADMSTQTGIPIKKLVILQEALRTSGSQMNDTSRVLSTLKDNLYEAGQEAGPARDALHKLGFVAGDFKGRKLEDSFKMIGQAVGNLPDEFEGLETVMSSLFGTKAGYKLIRFFKDFDGGMADAEKSVGQLAQDMEENARAMDAWGDSVGGLKNTMRSLWVNIWKAGAMGTDLIPFKESLQKIFSPENVQGFFKTVGDFFKTLSADIKDAGGMWNFLQTKGLEFAGMLGKQLADSIREAILASIDPNSFLGSKISDMFRPKEQRKAAGNGALDSIRGKGMSISAQSMRDIINSKITKFSDLVMPRKLETIDFPKEIRQMVEQQKIGNRSLQRLETKDSGWA